MAAWACGVAAAARAAATAPGLRLFILGALGGVAGVWEARESGVCMRFSAEPEGERMRTSGLLGAGGGGAAGAGAGAAGSAFAILQASCHRRISACARLSACFAARAALRRVRALVAARLLPCSERDSRLDLGERPCFAAGGRAARWEAGYTLTLRSAATRNPRPRGRTLRRSLMTSSRLSVADVAGEVPRIAARAVLANFVLFAVCPSVRPRMDD